MLHTILLSPSSQVLVVVNSTTTTTFLIFRAASLPLLLDNVFLPPRVSFLRLLATYIIQLLCCLCRSTSSFCAILTTVVELMIEKYYGKRKRLHFIWNTLRINLFSRLLSPSRHQHDHCRQRRTVGRLVEESTTPNDLKVEMEIDKILVCKKRSNKSSRFFCIYCQQSRLEKRWISSTTCIIFHSTEKKFCPLSLHGTCKLAYAHIIFKFSWINHWILYLNWVFQRLI